MSAGCDELGEDLIGGCVGGKGDEVGKEVVAESWMCVIDYGKSCKCTRSASKEDDLHSRLDRPSGSNLAVALAWPFLCLILTPL